MSNVLTNANRDAEDLSKYVTQESGTVTNRTGYVLTPLPVVEGQVIAQRDSTITAIQGYESDVQTERTDAINAIQLAEDSVQEELRAAIARTGYVEVGSFADGFTISERTEIAFYTGTVDPNKSTFYRWDGALPKTVAAGSTPSGTGGVDVGAWRDVGQAAIRADLTAEFGASVLGNGVVSVKTYEELLTLPASAKRDDLTYRVRSYHPITDYPDGFAVLSDNVTGSGDYFYDPVTAKFYPALSGGVVRASQFGMKESNTASQNSAAIQSAIDLAASFYPGDPSDGGRGLEACIPTGNFDYEGFILKSGVTCVRGAGRVQTILKLMGSNVTGIKGPAADSLVTADTVFWSGISDFSSIPGQPGVQTGVVQLDMVGLSRFTVNKVSLGWCDGVTGVRCTGSPATGLGGPGQFYNDFHEIFVERRASWPAGGFGWELGNRTSDLEQITTWNIYGGRTSGAGGGMGLHLISGSTINWYSHVIEGANVEIGFDGAGDRVCRSIAFLPGYLEGSGKEFKINANALNTVFIAGRNTGYTVNDLSESTLRFGDGEFKSFVPTTSSTVRGWEVSEESGATNPPVFSSSLFPSISLGAVDPADNHVNIANRATANGGQIVNRALSFYSGPTKNINNHTLMMNIGTQYINPGADNTSRLGDASLRYAEVFAANGTINTSDAREKTEVRAMSSAEIAASKQLSKEIGVYQWLHSVSDKGEDNARLHIGLTVQRAIEIMESNGLEPMRYGFICYDSWDYQPDEYTTIPEKKDDEGNIIEPEQTVKLSDERLAGDRYSFRYDQLNLFIARGLSARLDALEI